MQGRWFLCLIIMLVMGISPIMTVGQEAFLPSNLEPITVDNAGQLTEIASIGYGGVGQVFWMADGKTLAVKNSRGLWLHNAADLRVEPRLIAENVRGQTWISPDGTQIAIWHDETLEFRDIATDKILTTRDLPGRTGSVVFSRDWSIVVTGNAAGPEYFPLNGVVTVWDVASGKELAADMGNDPYFVPKISEDSRYVFSLINIIDVKTGNMTPGVGTLSPDGQVMVVRSNAYQDYTIDLKDFETQTTFAQIKHDAYISSIVFTPDSRFLILTDENHHVEVWRVQTGELVYSIGEEGHSRFVSAISPDSRVLAVTDGDGIDLYEVASGKAIGILPVASSGSLNFSPDGRQLATMSFDSGLQVWDTATAQLIDENSRYYDAGIVEALSADGSILVTSSPEAFKVWDTRTGKQTSALSHERYRFDADARVLSPDGQKWYAAGEGITVWNTQTGESHTFADDHYTIHDVAISGDGRLLASVSGDTSGGYCDQECPVPDNSLRLWDTASEMQLAYIPSGEESTPFLRVALSPDGKLLAALPGVSDRVNIWEVAEVLAGNIHPAAMIQADDVVSHIVFSQDHSAVAFTYGIIYATEGGLHLMTPDLAAMWKMDEVLKGGAGLPQNQASSFGVCCPDGAYDGSFNGDGSLFVTSGDDVRLWNAAAKVDEPEDRLVKSFDASGFVFSGDGRLLIVSGHDGVIHFWGIPSR